MGDSCHFKLLKYKMEKRQKKKQKKKLKHCFISFFFYIFNRLNYTFSFPPYTSYVVKFFSFFSAIHFMFFFIHFCLLGFSPKLGNVKQMKKKVFHICSPQKRVLDLFRFIYFFHPNTQLYFFSVELGYFGMRRGCDKVGLS